MQPRLRMRAAAQAAILAAIWISSCSDAPIEPPETPLTCDDSAPTAYVRSKIDDDDGDGNPLDEDFPAINDEDDDIADHAWIQDPSGVFHLFFQNEGHVTGNEIEHYTSRDLQTFEYVGVALRKNPDGWDSFGLWAPHVVAFAGTYYMLYTGVTGRDAFSQQRIGLATSTDLVNWTRYPVNHCPGTSGDGCLYECDEPWTTWGRGPGSYNQQCRDPFVIRDPVSQKWLLFATAKSTNQYGVVTVASSPDLLQWTGAGYIDATRRVASAPVPRSTGGQAENPAIMSHEGAYYLLFTDWQDPEDSCGVQNPRTISQYATSPTLMADSSGSPSWTYHGYIPDSGVNAIEVQVLPGDIWVMSESISNESACDHDMHRRELRLKCVAWDNALGFRTANLARFPGHVRAGAGNPMAIVRDRRIEIRSAREGGAPP